MAREGLFRRSIHAVDEHSGLASILSSVFTPTAEPDEGGFVQSALSAYYVGCSCKRTLFHWIQAFLNAKPSMMKHLLEGKRKQAKR